MSERVLRNPPWVKKEMAGKSLSKFAASLPVKIALKAVKVENEPVSLATSGHWFESEP